MYTFFCMHTPEYFNCNPYQLFKSIWSHCFQIHFICASWILLLYIVFGRGCLNYCIAILTKNIPFTSFYHGTIWWNKFENGFEHNFSHAFEGIISNEWTIVYDAFCHFILNYSVQWMKLNLLGLLQINCVMWITTITKLIFSQFVSYFRRTE